MSLAVSNNGLKKDNDNLAFSNHLTLKENENFFAIIFGRFVDSEFVKTCHEQVNRSKILWNHHESKKKRNK